jgi:ankyrin repeat protein
MLAAARGHKSLVTLLLSVGAIIDEWDREGETALILAAANGHKSVVNLLLDSGAEVDRNGNGKTALMSAAAHGHESVVSLLLERGGQRGVDGETPLTLAAANGHESVVNLLLERGAKVDQQGRDGETPLRLAAAHGHESVVNQLLGKGAKVDQWNLNGETPLMVVAASGHQSIANLLVERGAKIGQRNWDGETPLRLAAANGHESVVNLLLEKGAEVNQLSLDGETPLTLAATHGHESIVSLLLERGAKTHEWIREGKAVLVNLDDRASSLSNSESFNVRQPNNDRKTPTPKATRYISTTTRRVESWIAQSHLTKASAEGHESIAEMLFDNFRYDLGRAKESALITASTGGHEFIVKVLLDNLASSRSRAKESALIAASTGGHESVVEILLDNLASGHGRAKESALIAASARGHESVVKMLLDDLSYIHGRVRESALIAASTGGRESVVKMLLNNLPYIRTRAKASALIAASTGGHESVVKMLLGNLASGHGRAKESALIAASAGGHGSIVNMLLDNLTSGRGRAKESALITTSTGGRKPPKVVGMGQRYHEISYAKAISSAIFGAINGGGHEAIVRMLLSDIDSAVINPPQILGIVDNEGRTVLHLAVLYGYRRIVQLLLDNGADVGIADRQNMTPLFVAAISGATPIVLNPGTNTSLADPSDNPSAFRLMKLQLGLYVLGQEDSGFPRPMDKIKFLENSNCLYEYTCQEIGAALTDSTPFPEEQMKVLSDPFTSLIPDWGECLTGAHVRITMGSDFSAILRLDKFIGCGLQALGSHYIRVVVNLERKVGRTNNPFRLWEFLRASPLKQESRLQMQQRLAHNMALLYWTCGHEMKRAKAVCNGIPNRPRGGNCWRDAFGDVLELRLDRPDPFRQEALAPKQASHEGVPIRDYQLREIFSTCVLSTLEDLTAALGIHSRAVLGDIIFLQGRYGTCVLIGSINQYPVALWHVCSIEEASLIASNPQQFVYRMGGNLICENSLGGQDPYQGNYSSLESLKGTILVGTLVEPAWCTSIDTPILLQAQCNGVTSGRTEVNQIPRLQFESLSGQAQFSFGMQGPQGTIAIGGGVSRPKISEHIIAENSFSHSITTLERALRSWVLVYQTYSGQFVEQNLYCVVSCVLQVSHFRAIIATDLIFTEFTREQKRCRRFQ